MNLGGSAVETVDDPGLCGLVLFMEPKDVGGGFDVVDDQGFMVLLGELDVFFKHFDLKIDGVLVEAVDACFADGSDTVFLEEGFQTGQGGLLRR